MYTVSQKIHLFIFFRLSSVCLSVVCNVGAPYTQGVEPFGNISSLVCIWAIRWPSCKILRRSPQETLRSVALNARGVTK